MDTMQIDCRWFLRGHLDLHSRKTVSALRQYNAPASLEWSESKIKISKGLCIVEVAGDLTLICGERIAKALKIKFCPQMVRTGLEQIQGN
jgi:hypothetical protein